MVNELVSIGCWQASLGEALSRRPYSGEPPRIAVVGVGHDLRGDDAAGLWVAHALQPLVAGNESLLAIEAGMAPENASGQLRRFRPDLVLLVDAADMGAEPGTVRWLSCRDTTGITASTHTPPMHILASYLTAEFGCAVALLGIQPADIALGAPLSPLVREAVETTAGVLAKVLHDCTCPAASKLEQGAQVALSPVER